MSSESTTCPRRAPRYPGGKVKRHLYLTEVAHNHIVDLADAHGMYPSEIVEQIIRLHIAAVNLPAPTPPIANLLQLSLLTPYLPNSPTETNHGLAVS